MSKDEVMKLLAEAGALVTNSHIIYTSGRHGSAYINKDALYVHTEATSRVGELMAADYDADQVDVVAGPTIGGVVLSQWVAYHLTKRRKGGETLAVYAEEEGAERNRLFKRGYDQHIKGKNVVIVEDVVTTGGSVAKVVDAVRALDGKILGASLLCNRGGIGSDAVGGVTLNALTAVTLDSYPEDDCPLCREGVPINTSVGKGKAYLAARK